ncbi:DNA replication and repair protein RecF [Patescibacteria group bacterium]|nr:DNA replication and repair protein RecF [Patescibacteria group bacterium]
MRLLSIRIANFRNVQKGELEFGSNNFLVGDNAQGKTNVLEAIHFLSTGRSFREKQDSWLINYDEQFSLIEAKCISDNGEMFELGVGLEREEQKIKKVFKYNQRKTTKKEFLGKMPMVLFAPDEIGLLRLYPSMRRTLLNQLITKTKLTYFDDLMRYTWALKQRNELLRLIKIGNRSDSELGIWDAKLALLGAGIIANRQQVVNSLNVSLRAVFSELGGAGDLQLVYQTSLQSELPEVYLEHLKNCRSGDIIYGHTTIGPHRDDLQFMVDGRDAKHFASQGEFRLILIALKLVEGQYLNDMLKEQPIYLLDDIFSELDNQKVDKLVAMLKGRQAILTTTHQEIVEGLNSDSKTWLIEKGVVHQKELISDI